jgi:hypothetical protein
MLFKTLSTVVVNFLRLDLIHRGDRSQNFRSRLYPVTSGSGPCGLRSRKRRVVNTRSAASGRLSRPFVTATG